MRNIPWHVNLYTKGRKYLEYLELSKTYRYILVLKKKLLENSCLLTQYLKGFFVLKYFFLWNLEGNFTMLTCSN